MITENAVVSINYVLTDDQGTILDASNGQPLEYLHGFQNIIPGLEKALNGLNPGDKKKVTVPPEEAYGQYNPEMRFAIPREYFGENNPQPGMVLQLELPEGVLTATVIGAEGEEVYMDANHPLAGQKLHFDVEVIAIRQATQEEISHGHPHGPGGHHH